MMTGGRGGGADGKVAWKLTRLPALAEWLKKDYKFSDSEVALVLGAVAKYDITELVDPQFNVVAKIPKSALKTLQ
jgi:acetamidase/formamidase